MSNFNFSDPASPDYDVQCDPATYRLFATDDIEYYLHVFTEAARLGTSPGIHAERCAELAAMLSALLDYKKNTSIEK